MNTHLTKKVLVMDKDHSTAQTLENLFQMNNIALEIVKASTVAEAVEKVELQSRHSNLKRFDLIVGDIFWGELASELNTWSNIYKSHPDIPFLALSKFPEFQILESLNIQDPYNFNFLKKPFTRLELWKKLVSIPLFSSTFLKNGLSYSTEKTNEIHRQLRSLLVLKLSIDWIEKQSWLDVPYGGQNQAQEMLMQARILTEGIEDFCFSNRINKSELEKFNVESKIKKLLEIAPELDTIIGSNTLAI